MPYAVFVDPNAALSAVASVSANAGAGGAAFVRYTAIGDPPPPGVLGDPAAISDPEACAQLDLALRLAARVCRGGWRDTWREALLQAGWWRCAALGALVVLAACLVVLARFGWSGTSVWLYWAILAALALGTGRLVGRRTLAEPANRIRGTWRTVWQRPQGPPAFAVEFCGVWGAEVEGPSLGLAAFVAALCAFADRLQQDAPRRLPRWLDGFKQRAMSYGLTGTLDDTPPGAPLPAVDYIQEKLEAFAGRKAIETVFCPLDNRHEIEVAYAGALHDAGIPPRLVFVERDGCQVARYENRFELVCCQSLQAFVDWHRGALPRRQSLVFGGVLVAALLCLLFSAACWPVAPSLDVSLQGVLCTPEAGVACHFAVVPGSINAVSVRLRTSGSWGGVRMSAAADPSLRLLYDGPRSRPPVAWSFSSRTSVIVLVPEGQSWNGYLILTARNAAGLTASRTLRFTPSP